jgi:cytochrome d ubiquinol oxidase subunit I
MFGSNLSALWIILANGWMQRPVGYTMTNGRALLEDFTAVLTNSYSWGAYVHTITAAWALSGFFVLGVSAWHLARKSETAFFARSVRIAAPFTLIMTLAVAFFGHAHGQVMGDFQPIKLAAMESHWQTAKDAPIYLLAWPNAEETGNAVQAVPVPGLLSFMATGSSSGEVKGLNEFPAQDRPPVLLTFLSFRVMAGLGVLLILLAFVAWRYREKLGEAPGLAKALTYAIPLPYIAIMAGWTLAEVGRQPWIAYGLLRTGDAASPIPGSSVALSLIAFLIVYGCLGAVGIYLFGKNACAGPATQK